MSDTRMATSPALSFDPALLLQVQRIRVVFFDVDGVLTDGALYLADSGEEIKAFNSLDGHGMKMLRESGVELAIITGRTSRIVELPGAYAFARDKKLALPPGLVAIRRQGIYFAMITLALSQLLYFIYLQAPFTHGEDGIGISAGETSDWTPSW